ncbi:MAG: LamG domain-containing protein [Deltaproteobacteria bacterium]|nr:LamG domain-containing protein [Deltaproteobacteria bacterium]
MADGEKFQGWPVVESEVTSDATITDLMTYELGADQSVKLLVSVFAQRYDDGESNEVYSYDAIHLFNKAGAANAALRGSSTPVEVDPQTTGWTVTVDADVNNARVRVTGTASEDVRWIGRIDVLQVEQDVLGTFSQLSSTFNGTDEYVTMGDVLDFDRTDPLSISLWFKVSSGGAFLVSKMEDGGTNRGYGLYLVADGRLQLIFYGNTAVSDWMYAATTATWIDGDWHHVVFMHDGSSTLAGLTCYVDGASQAFGTTADNLLLTTVSSAPFMIGTRTALDAYLAGKIDDVAIYDSELSLAEVTAIYNSGEPVDNRLLSSEPDMVGYWRMGDGATSPTIQDDSTNSNDGTMVNMDASNFTADVPS